MKMKSKLLYVPVVMAVLSALAVTATTTRRTTTPHRRPTTETSGLDLNGKMFTLSSGGRGGISFFPPHFYPSPSSWPYTTPYPSRPYYTPTTTRPYYPTTTRPTTTRPYYTPTTTHPTPTRPYYTTTYPWTTAPPTRGVSVCLRFLCDYAGPLFTLSPSSGNALRMELSNGLYYTLYFDRSYYTLSLRPNIKFWSNIGQDIWTRVCLTVDSVKNVAQVFSGTDMSIRKMLPDKYVWRGQPVIDFSGFDGQLTDVQIWDYPLRYKEVFYYMTSGSYGSYRGSVLTWSYISYSLRGNTLLEDTYDWQARQPINRLGRKGHRPMGGKKTKKFFNLGESKRQQL